MPNFAAIKKVFNANAAATFNVNTDSDKALLARDVVKRILSRDVLLQTRPEAVTDGAQDNRLLVQKIMNSHLKPPEDNRLIGESWKKTSDVDNHVFASFLSDLFKVIKNKIHDDTEADGNVTVADTSPLRSLKFPFNNDDFKKVMERKQPKIDKNPFIPQYYDDFYTNSIKKVLDNRNLNGLNVSLHKLANGDNYRIDSIWPSFDQ